MSARQTSSVSERAGPSQERPAVDLAASTASASEHSAQGTQIPVLDEASWAEAVAAVRSAAPRVGTSLAFGRLLSFSAPELTLAFARQHAFHRGVVAGSGRAQVEQLLAVHLRVPVRLRIEDASATTQAPLSPAEREAEQQGARRRDVEAKVRSHTSVQAVRRLLGGEIEQIHVVEPSRSDLPDTSDEPS